MMDRKRRTTALQCNSEGGVIQVLRDDLGLCHDAASPRPICELVDEGTKDKAALFLETLRDRKVVLDWPLNVSVDGRIATLRFCGVRGEETAVIAVSDSRSALAHLDAALEHLSGREAGAMQTLLREEGLKSLDEMVIDGELYDELTRLNNELVTAQRELTKKNLELRALGESRRLKAEDARRQQVQVLEQVHDAVIATDLDGVVQIWNHGAEQLYGYTSSEAVGRNIEFLYGASYLASLKNKTKSQQDGPSEQVLRAKRKSGEEIQVAIRSSPLRDATHTIRGIITCSNDVTLQKEAEEALRGLAGRLIAARENERRRIARELHDDVNQKLAALAMELGHLMQNISPPDRDLGSRLLELQQQTLGLSHDVRRLSHRLHPAAMEHVGLAVALRSYCSEFSREQNLKVRVSLTDELGNVHPDVALALYRVVQESLRNVAKHSRATEARVSLSKTEDGLHLSISDNGVGFGEEETRSWKGLGVVSMEERIRLLKGDFSLESHSGGGTRVEVRIPAGGNTL